MKGDRFWGKPEGFKIIYGVEPKEKPADLPLMPSDEDKLSEAERGKIKRSKLNCFNIDDLKVPSIVS